MTHHFAVVAATACSLVFLACLSRPPALDDSPNAAVLDGSVISVAALDAWIKDETFKQQTGGGNPARIYQFRRSSLDQLIERRVVEAEAERSGLDADAFVRQEVEANNPVTQEDVVKFFEENRERMGNSTFDDVSPQIREYLEKLRAKEARQGMVARAAVTIELEPPRVEIESDGPSWGPEDAAVTIVEFGDFLCPYCRQARNVLYSLVEKYPEEVRVVYRHLPLETIHPRAQAAAEASECAADQGLFWEYHNRLFNNPQAFGDEDLRGHAREIGADGEVFDACVDNREHAARIDADAAAAAELGITGTPAFVINGILLFGLQSEETMDRLIRDELANVDAARAATP
jgi:protein-disulfide isomerase